MLIQTDCTFLVYLVLPTHRWHHSTSKSPTPQVRLHMFALAYIRSRPYLSCPSVIFPHAMYLSMQNLPVVSSRYGKSSFDWSSNESSRPSFSRPRSFFPVVVVPWIPSWYVQLVLGAGTTLFYPYPFLKSSALSNRAFRHFCALMNQGNFISFLKIGRAHV